MANKSGLDYFFQGFDLISRPGVRLFVIVPLIINVLLFGAAFYYLFGQIDPLVQQVTDWVPSWLDWLKEGLAYIIWPLAVLIILLFSAFIFGTLANWIAAPFNGLLSERIELMLTGQPISDDGFTDLIKDIPRTLAREVVKLGYYLPRAILFLLMFFLLPLIGQVIWFLFTAWMMAVQYCDYPFDNHKVPFKKMRLQLANDKPNAFMFGITVTFFSMIPIVNFVVMPVAICGATAMWVDKYRDKYTEQ
ncbi:sulfate transporter CysZ [Planctobacterium marinum]|uniref:Sulfate transporter CysZ n=1 Tax=Planctobacterium marinum TaxID=1631968 RepID=A0AA48KNX0_9ALTE|nr:sulfate transporter CysZ [Planctobacterium marinum]